MTAYSTARGRMSGRRRRSNEERFIEKIRATPSGCWEWEGWCDKDGYGMFNFRFPDDTLKDIRASHASLNLFCDIALPLDAQACHHCDWPPCVNPDHLFKGTQGDNVNDMIAKDRHMRGERNYNAVLNEDLVVQMRSRHANGERITAIAASLGLKRSTAGAAIAGQNWLHV